jgi:hypothetical protein
MGARRAWSWRSVEGEMRRRADESRECWDFESQRCMRRGSFGQTDAYDQWNGEGQGADERENDVAVVEEMRR